MGRGKEGAEVGARQTQALIKELEDGKRVAEELLYLVVDKYGPLELEAEVIHEGIQGDKMIDLTLDTQRDTWVLQTVAVD